MENPLAHSLILVSREIFFTFEGDILQLLHDQKLHKKKKNTEFYGFLFC